MSLPQQSAEIDSADLEAYRLRARAWLKDNLEPVDLEATATMDDEARWARARVLQRKLFDAGYAGICYPREYGGQGLSPEYQTVFTEESIPYEMPIAFNLPTLAICLPTILEVGNEAQREQHVRGVLSGEEVLVEFLSEPHSGSDLAGALTRAEKDGDNWVLNGSKIWTSHAYVGDYALCLARTDWDVPKHQGLTMFLVPVKHPNITIRRIRQVNNKSEFCEEFFDNVVLGPESVLGEVNGGWDVASKRFYYSRTAWGRGNPYINGSHEQSQAQSKGMEIADIDAIIGLGEATRAWTGLPPAFAVESYVNGCARDFMAKRVIRAVELGVFPPEAASMVRLFHAEIDWKSIDAAMIACGSQAATGKSLDDSGYGAFAENYLFRQATSLGGGTTEMARNGISERVLKMPREKPADLGLPFREVRRLAAEARAQRKR